LEDEIQRARAGPLSSGRHAMAPVQRPATGFAYDDPALHDAWEKLHRAREIFEAEQAHLRNDRFAIRDQEVALKRGEEALAQREERLATFEAAFAATPALPAGGTKSLRIARFMRRSPRRT
jgi:hypothetical protein